MSRTPRRSLAWIALAWLALASSSCAYYNTYYLAKRYYSTATGGLPYPVEKPTGAQTGNYQKSIDYSKKVIANYPKSKWVDDAYLMWAQGLLGKDDPIQAVNMLQDFHRRFPESSRRAEATFYLGVAHRQARKPREALLSLDEFLEMAPKHELAPYAHLERSRALTSLARPAEAAQAASRVIEDFPKSPLVERARAERAEALLAGGDPLAARKDFQQLGFRAVDDDARFAYLLREADCLEAARDDAGGLALLQGALAHEPAPVKTPSGAAPTGPGVERYGQLTMRIGTVHLQAGRPEPALAAYRNVLQDYPKTGLAAEAQYRIGYTYEIALDDFTAARQEYAKVRDQSVSSPFFAQATQRQQSLDRLERFRSAGADSVERKVEAGFLLAEQYLFQLDKPERAIEAYAAIARDYPGTPAAGKAMNAEAWVLRRKLERGAEADSLLWRVVREHPETEAQLAARDYLEAEGHAVPAELIKIAQPPEPPPDTTLQLTSPPSDSMPLGPQPRRDLALSSPAADSLMPPSAYGPQMGPALLTGMPGPADSIARASMQSPARFDSIARARAAGVPPPPPPKPDSTAGAKPGGAAVVSPGTAPGSQPVATGGAATGAAAGATAGAAGLAGSGVQAVSGAPQAAGTQAGKGPPGPAAQASPGPTSAPQAGGGLPAGSGAQAGAAAGAGAASQSAVGPAAGPSAQGAQGAPGSVPQPAPGTQTGPTPARADSTARASADTLRARPRPAVPARPDTVWAPR